MEQTTSNHNAVVNSEYLDDSDLKHLPFDTPAEIERYWTLAAERIKSDFVIEGGRLLVDVDFEDNPPRKLPTEIVQMELASALGDIAAVEAVYQFINESPDWATPPPLFRAFQDEALTRWLLDYGANPNAQCVLDLTPLSIAMCYAPSQTIQMLFRYGGSIEHGQLLHLAVRRALADRVKVVNYILDMGPPINDIMYQHQPYSYSLQEDYGIGTALHGAAELLLARGADPLAKDAKGELAIEKARRESQEKVVDLILLLSS